MSANEIFSDNADTHVGDPSLLLGRGIDHTKLGPVDGLGQERGAHITDKRLVVRYIVEWEIIVF